MKIRVTREAVCSADDQNGPLGIDLNISEEETIEQLISRIEDSGFLQFSSSHVSITGFSAKVPIVTVYDKYYSKAKNEFFVERYKPLKEFIENGLLDFAFKTERP